MRPPPPAETLAAMSPQSSCPRPRPTRVAAVITATAAAALLSACGSGPTATAANAGGSTTSASVAAWIACIHTHGVPNYPGPDSRGDIPKIKSGQQVGVSDAQLHAASDACQALWPYHAPTQAQTEQQLVNDLKFARCMRASGLPNFPDPTTIRGQATFVFSASRDGFNPQSPQILAKARNCLKELPPGSPLPHASEEP
jgi:hypothetical protein